MNKSKLKDKCYCIPVPFHTDKHINCIDPLNCIYASIDPGEKNCGLRIEERRNGRCHQVILFKTLCFSFRNLGRNVEDTQMWFHINEQLNEFKPYFSIVDIFLIENQMHISTINVSVMRHMIGFFIEHFTNTQNHPAIIIINAKEKGKYIRDTKNVKRSEKIPRSQLKKYALEIARDVLERDNDQRSINILERKKSNIHGKKTQDDIADTVCQLERFIYCVREGMIDSDGKGIC